MGRMITTTTEVPIDVSASPDGLIVGSDAIPAAPASGATGYGSGDVEGRADAVNGAFHESYERARAEASREVPVLVILGDDLILVQGETRSVTPCIPALFHWTKVIAHAPVAVVAVHLRCPSTWIDDSARTLLESLAGSTSALLRSLESADVTASHGATVKNLVQIVVATTAQIKSTLASGRLGSELVRSFAAATGPLLLQSTKDATALQLSALHAVLPGIMRKIDATDRASLEVVVVGAHQARARNLPMQYFQKLFGEAPGDERRVSYAENAASVEDALAQVGTRRLDREIARAFFGDERRLQRDVLGDAAKEQLARLDLAFDR